MFAYDDFLALADFQLLLWRYFVVASRAAVAVYRNNRQPILIGCPQSTVYPHQPLLDIFFRGIGLLGQFILFFLGFPRDGVRSDDRRVGKGCFITVNSRGSASAVKTNK